MVERVDQGVGEILRALDRAGLANNTIVIFTNDNGGEWLSQQRAAVQPQVDRVGGGHPRAGADAVAGTNSGGQGVAQVGITMDLTASILAATGTAVPADARLEGIESVADSRGPGAGSRAHALLAHDDAGNRRSGRCAAATGSWWWTARARSSSTCARDRRAAGPAQPASGHRARSCGRCWRLGEGRRRRRTRRRLRRRRRRRRSDDPRPVGRLCG